MRSSSWFYVVPSFWRPVKLVLLCPVAASLPQGGGKGQGSSSPKVLSRAGPFLWPIPPHPQGWVQPHGYLGASPQPFPVLLPPTLLPSTPMSYHKLDGGGGAVTNLGPSSLQPFFSRSGADPPPPWVIITCDLGTERRAWGRVRLEMREEAQVPLTEETTVPISQPFPYFFLRRGGGKMRFYSPNPK